MDRDEMRRRGPTRRDVITTAGASALVLTTGAGMAHRMAHASGSVFEDRSGTGQRRSGDPGIAGVMVSNGRDVVRTDRDGRWRLPVAEGDHLFVVKPPRWATPVGAGGVPQFSWLHQPQGSPRHIEYRHAGVAPTPPLPASIDFPLRRQDEHADFEALLIADTQPENGEELGYLRDDIVAGALETKAAFGINHGDIVFDDLSLYPRYLQIMSATGVPWHHCPGNHDMNSEAPSDHVSRETWKRVFGPRHYAFQYAGATFILLDNVHYFGYNRGAPRSGTYCGLVGEQQLQFVRNVLAHLPGEQLVVLSMHIPLATYLDPTNSADNTIDRGGLLELLAGRPHCVSFSGHMHLTEHHYLDCGGTHAAHHHHVLAAASGAWWGGTADRRGIPFADSADGTPNGFHVLAVDGCRYTTRFVPAAGKAQGRVRVMIDGPHRPGSGGLSGAPICSHEVGGSQLIVNIFDGGPRTSVSYDIPGDGPRPMQRVAMKDPFVCEFYARQPGMQKGWVRPVVSSHVWRAPLPAHLSAGAHRLRVVARDEYGTEIVTHKVLEVAPAAASVTPA
jgi:hypothetical protein